MRARQVPNGSATARSRESRRRATNWEWSRTVGHLGAGDQFASLAHLVDSGRARPGDRCVLIGVGAGYSWGCAVVEIDTVPDWLAA